MQNLAAHRPAVFQEVERSSINPCSRPASVPARQGRQMGTAELRPVTDGRRSFTLEKSSLRKQPRRRNLWVTDTLQWAPEARLAQPANPMQDSAASAFPVRSQLPCEQVCPLRLNATSSERGTVSCQQGRYTTTFSRPNENVRVDVYSPVGSSRESPVITCIFGSFVV